MTEHADKTFSIVEQYMALLQTSSATSAVAQSMGTAAKAMASIGQANDPAEIQRIMQQFQKENMKMEMAGDMMDDALDSAFDGDELDEETDDVMNEVCVRVHSHPRFAVANIIYTVN